MHILLQHAAGWTFLLSSFLLKKTLMAIKPNLQEFQVINKTVHDFGMLFFVTIDIFLNGYTDKFNFIA